MSHLQVSYSRHLEINSGKADSIRPSIEASNLCEQSQPRKQFFSRGANPPIVGQELLLNIAFLIDDDNRWSRNITSGWVTSNVTKPEGVNHFNSGSANNGKVNPFGNILSFTSPAVLVLIPINTAPLSSNLLISVCKPCSSETQNGHQNPR